MLNPNTARIQLGHFTHCTKRSESSLTDRASTSVSLWEPYTYGANRTGARYNGSGKAYTMGGTTPEDVLDGANIGDKEAWVDWGM